MSGYTNSATFDDGSNLFMDAPEDTTEDVQEPVEHESATDTADPDEPADKNEPEEHPADPDTTKDDVKPGIRITYMGEAKDLTYDEAVVLAQKGMNYDKILQERDTYKATHDEADRSLRELGKWAKQANMTMPEYVEHLQGVRRAQSISREISSIREKYPDIPEEAAKEMAEARIKDSDAEEQRAAQERRQTEEAAAQEPWIDFVRRYPDMSQVEKIPAEVLAEIESGARPVEAMQRYEIQDMRKQISELNTKMGQLEQNKKNKDTALPAAGNSRDDKAEDPFLAGLGL